MKVVFVSPYLPARDGIATYTGRLVAEFERHGHTVAVATPSSVAAGARTAPGWTLGHGLRQGHLAQAIADTKPDVVHVQFAVAAFGTRTPQLVGLVNELDRRDVRLVITFHEVTRDVALLGSVGRALYRHLAGSADAVIVHTAQSRSVLVDGMGVPAGSVTVVPHPTGGAPAAGDTRPPARFGVDGQRTVLAFGFIHVDKGLPDLVAAIGLLIGSGADERDAEEFADVRLVVAGVVRPRQGAFRLFELRDHLHLRRARRQAARLGLGDRVVWTGYVPDTEIAAWFTSATATVLPYRRIEESGVANIAAALQAPILASTAGGLAERFGSQDWSFPPADPAALAATLRRFLRAPEAVRRQAIPHRQETTLAQVVDATLLVYG